MKLHLFRSTLVVAATVLLLASCETVQTTQGGAVGVGRQQRMAISAESIEQSARQQYAQVLAEERQKGNLNRNPAQLNRIRGITNRLIPQTFIFRPDAQKWQWEVSIITSKEINAWCMPGGKVVIFSGIIEQLQLTDDEVAAVLGHEISHALREHARERASEQMGVDMAATGIEILGVIYGVEGLGKVANTGLQLGIGLPNSRMHETEADRMGVELAARAGYDPRAAVTLWHKMAHASTGEAPQFLSTHPSRESRQNDLADYSQRVMPLYLQSKKQH